jgi:integrase
VPRPEKKLSSQEVKSLTSPGRHSDGGGLYLSIDASGRRRWVFMYTSNGRRVELGLGSTSTRSLKEAREEAASLRASLARGLDPRVERSKSTTKPTFGEFSDEYVEAMRPSWRNAKHAAQWSMTLTEYAKPLRSLPIDAVTTEEILRTLRPIWKRTPETAERLRGRIENVLSSAKAKGLRKGENPATWKGHLDQLLPKRQRLTRGHHAAMQYEGVAEFFANLSAKSAMAARALQFLILTAARSGEVLGATWSEVDLDRGLWVVPASRMKAGKEHRVPLSKAAINVLRSVDVGLRPDDYLFWGKSPDRPLSNMAMSMLLRRMVPNVTVHGFRSSFRDWAAEVSAFSHEVCEMALAHTIPNKVEAAYRRGDLLDKRRELMDAWSLYVDPDHNQQSSR